MHENDGFLKEGQLLNESRISVEISSSRLVQIRRFSRITLAIAIGGIPDLAALATDDQEGRGPTMTLSQAEAAMRAIDKILIEGVLQPKLHAQSSEGVTPSDFSEDDRMTIYHAILDHSGWNKKAAREVIPFSGTSA